MCSWIKIIWGIIILINAKWVSSDQYGHRWGSLDDQISTTYLTRSVRQWLNRESHFEFCVSSINCNVVRPNCPIRWTPILTSETKRVKTMLLIRPGENIYFYFLISKKIPPLYDFILECFIFRWRIVSLIGTISGSKVLDCLILTWTLWNIFYKNRKRIAMRSESPK